MAAREHGPYEPAVGIRAHLGDAVRSVAVLRRQLALRVPRPGYRQTFGSPALVERTAEIVTELRRDGIVVLAGHVQEPLLGQLQRAFERTVREPATEIPDALEDVDFFWTDPAFVAVALDDLALKVAARYYGRPFFLGRAEACRLLRSVSDQYGSYQWHHDTRGKQLKLMVLLSNVDVDGQRMRYVAGTHRRLYSHRRLYGPGSRFEQDLRHNPPDRLVEVVGPAGTVAFFDTNGLHSGTRNASAPRDTVTITYTTGRSVRPLRFARRDVEELAEAKRQVITSNPAHALV